MKDPHRNNRSYVAEQVQSATYAKKTAMKYKQNQKAAQRLLLWKRVWEKRQEKKTLGGA